MALFQLSVDFPARLFAQYLSYTRLEDYLELGKQIEHPVPGLLKLSRRRIIHRAVFSDVSSDLYA